MLDAVVIPKYVKRILNLLQGEVGGNLLYFTQSWLVGPPVHLPERPVHCAELILLFQMTKNT